MDIMDIQAVESKLSDVTVTPIPRSQVQNFYNYQQQREQREQQPQIQISAIHHPPRDRHSHAASSNDREDVRGGSSGHSSTGRDLYASHHSKRERDYHQQLSQLEAAVAGAGGMGANPVVTAAALQYAQQLQAQLALLQQQANTNASPSITLTPANPRAAALTSSLASSLSMTPIPNTTNTNNNTSSNNISITSNGGGSMGTGPTPSQLKYPQSTSPLFLSNTQAAKLVAPVNSSNSIDLQSTSSSSVNTGANNTQNNGLTKYAQLLAVIEEMGRDIRPTYTGSRSSTERLKRGIVHARILVRECLMETERSARQ